MFGGLIANAGRVALFRRDPRGGVRLGIEDAGGHRRGRRG